MKKIIPFFLTLCLSFMCDIQAKSEKIIGDGSIENPIILRVKDYQKIQDMQKDYIWKHYQDYKVKGNTLSVDKNGIFTQFIVLQNDENKEIVICFDITEACKEYKKSKDKNFKNRVKVLMESKK